MPPKRKASRAPRRASAAPAAPAQQPEERPVEAAEGRLQTSSLLTTAQGVRLPDTDHSLKAGSRGPTLMDDFHLREKITHFDHERIPERVVHARGAAAHGTFTAYGNAASVTKAGFLQRGRETPVFVRFSTVLGSRGSADTVRDVRGFAVKFYTDEGNFDLVGNNMPVFFIQDGIKFPDIIHAGKPHPDREIPQAQTAHDTFWDFVSLHTEATHHVMWAMSDRGIPRSYRTMEGFGVHTFRLVNDRDETCLVKFHWKPVAGIHSLVWEEAQIAAGTDPDFHRRDLADGIARRCTAGVRTGTADHARHRRPDLRGHRSARPDEDRARGALRRCSRSASSRLDRNPTNYFAETEQVAFHTGHLVPGHRGHRRPADAGPAVLLPRHPADPPRRTQLHPVADQLPARRGQRQPPRRDAPDRSTPRHRAVPAQQSRPGRRTRRLPRSTREPTFTFRARSAGPRCGRTRHRSPTTSPRPRCSGRA